MTHPRHTLAGLGLLALLVLPAASQAMLRMGGDEVVVAAHEVIDDDLVIVGDFVSVQGVVKGDLVVYGSTVEVSGIVEQDLLVAAKTLHLEGSVNDDARLLVYAFALGSSGRVADDLQALAYSVETRVDSLVGGSVQIVGWQARLAGQIAEALFARVGALELHGLVGGDVDATLASDSGITSMSVVVDPELEVPELLPGLRVIDGAQVGGDLVYRAAEPAEIGDRAEIVGEVRHEELTDPPPPVIGYQLDPDWEWGGPESEAGEGLRRFFVLLAVAGVLALVLPRWTADRADVLRAELGLAFGWGLGSLVVLGMASGAVALVGFILVLLTAAVGGAGTVIGGGLLLQLALFAPYGLAAGWGGPAIAAVAIGRTVVARLAPGRGGSLWLAVPLGAALYALIGLVPGFGWLFAFGATFAGIGALVLWLRDVLAPSEPGMTR